MRAYAAQVPSYRAVQEIVDVRPGHAPAEVLDAAVAACATSGHRVEARDVELIAGRARIWVRYTVGDAAASEEDAEAWEIADAVRAAVCRVAIGGVAQPFRRVGGRWVRVPRPRPEEASGSVG